MESLADILARSKQVMDKTKDLPRGKNTESSAIKLQERMQRINTEPVFSESAAQKSKLPKAIIEAMRESTSSASTSILDDLQPKTVKKIAETKEVTKQQPSNQQSTVVDYPLIKLMMEDTMKKYLSKMQKNIINESQGNNLQLMTQKGNTFRFVTEDGKIFEGKLTYKGNINDK